MTNSEVKGCLLTVTKTQKLNKLTQNSVTLPNYEDIKSCFPMTQVVLLNNFQPKVCISCFLAHPTCLLYLTSFTECPLPVANKQEKL